MNLVRRVLGAGVLGAAKASQTLFFIASIIPTIFYYFGEGIFRQRGLGSRAGVTDAFLYSLYYPHYFFFILAREFLGRGAWGAAQHTYCM